MAGTRFSLLYRSNNCGLAPSNGWYLGYEPIDRSSILLWGARSATTFCGPVGKAYHVVFRAENPKPIKHATWKVFQQRC